MCIPIVTIGASTTAAYYTVFKQLEGKDGYVVRNFFKSFKMNFFQATAFGFIIFVGNIFVATNLFLISNDIVVTSDFIKLLLMFVQFFILFELMILNYYGFALLSKIEFRTKDLIKTSFILGNKHLLVTLGNILTIVGITWAVQIVPSLMIFALGTYFIVSASLIKRVIVKYRPEVFDKLENDDDSFRVNTEDN